MQLMVEPFSVGPNVVPFKAAGELPLHYVYFVIQGLVETQEYKRHWNDLIGKPVTVGSPAIARLFSEAVEPLLALGSALLRKNLLLGRMRDLLLPKLVSGKLDVSELDIKTDEEAA